MSKRRSNGAAEVWQPLVVCRPGHTAAQSKRHDHRRTLVALHLPHALALTCLLLPDIGCLSLVLLLLSHMQAQARSR